MLHRRGFTLIELLVAITIIGILSAVVFSGFGGSQAQTRDQERIFNLKNVQLALERYKADKGRYPEGCADNPTNQAWNAPQSYHSDSGTVGAVGIDFRLVDPGESPRSGVVQCIDYIQGLVPEYLDQLPDDPFHSNNDGVGYRYAVAPNGAAYKFMAHHSIETLRAADNNQDLARCPEICSGSIFADHESWCVTQTEYQGGVVVQGHTLAVFSPGAECW